MYIGLLQCSTVCPIPSYLTASVTVSSPKATTYKLDFDQERSDRQEAAGKFDEERQTWQKDILALNEKQEKLLFERDEIYAQLEQLKEASAGHKREVSVRHPDYSQPAVLAILLPVYSTLLCVAMPH